MGGNFREVDGIEMHDIARWDGSTWTPVARSGGPGTFGDRGTFGGNGVFALAADPNLSALWVGGGFALTNGVPSNYIARWTCGEEEEPGPAVPLRRLLLARSSSV